MSIFESFLRLFDPIAYRQRKQEQRRKRDTARPHEVPDLPPRRAPPVMQCRLCDSQGTGEFCLRCLAATMERRRR